ncbi:MAG: ParA family protein [Fibrobacter sp.]|nr:ParA family protein [Fibrobacter sp.]
MRTIAVLNHKGGVGKTTFCGSTAQALALIGFRVLVIDNDSQHNLSSMLGVGVKHPNIRDVYIADNSTAPSQLLKSVRKTDIPGLHIITSCRDLSDSDVPHNTHLKNALQTCSLGRFYDYLLIDNAPGIDHLQASAIIASDEIFVPTELKQFAVDGIAEMELTLRERYPDGARITKIVPNFYKNVKRQNSFIAALSKLFPGRVTETSIPFDSVFDELVTDNKILFLHRLYSKGAACYIKLVHELFNLDEDTVWEQVKGKRDNKIKDDARKRLTARKIDGGMS